MRPIAIAAALALLSPPVLGEVRDNVPAERLRSRRGELLRLVRESDEHFHLHRLAKQLTDGKTHNGEFVTVMPIPGGRGYEFWYREPCGRVQALQYTPPNAELRERWDRLLYK